MTLQEFQCRAFLVPEEGPLGVDGEVVQWKVLISTLVVQSKNLLSHVFQNG